MFGKLAFRNVRRSARDYLVYVLTMTFIVALMFAFNSIIFSRDIQKMYELAGMMAAMIGIATFFIVLIVAWLINYMVRFMLEKRSQQFHPDTVTHQDKSIHPVLHPPEPQHFQHHLRIRLHRKIKIH